MEVVTDQTSWARPEGGTVVTIGAYDGVHLGHRVVIGEVKDLAAARGVASAVVTFDRHPATVVRPESAPPLLTDLGQRLELLAATGVDITFVVTFDQARSEESAEDFVTEVLVGRLGARLVVVGRDFHFGHRRRGNLALLAEMGAGLGFEVVGMDLVPGADGGEPVSSTRIRQLLSGGRVEEAARLLGRPHEVRGRVERGDGRGGAVLGYPTANLALPPDILLPRDGIYAGWYERPGGATYPAAISVGRRPTFYEDGPRLLEAYLVGFDGDLYGEPARVRFVAWLHEERAFGSIDELVAQMGQDVDATRAALGHPA